MRLKPRASLTGMAVLTLLYFFFLWKIFGAEDPFTVSNMLVILSMPLGWILYVLKYRRTALGSALLLELPLLIVHWKALLLILFIV